MSDKYSDVRSVPLKSVLASLGLTDLKKAAGKTGTVWRLSVTQPKEKQNVSFATEEKLKPRLKLQIISWAEAQLFIFNGSARLRSLVRCANSAKR